MLRQHQNIELGYGYTSIFAGNSNALAEISRQNYNNEMLKNLTPFEVVVVIQQFGIENYVSQKLIEMHSKNIERSTLEHKMLQILLKNF